MKANRWLLSGAADQALMSMGTLLLMSVAANLLGASGFGQFALAWTFVQVGVSASRSLVGETIIARGYRGIQGGPEGAAVLIGSAALVVFAFLGLVIANFRDPFLVASGVVLFIVFQDTLRFGLIEERRSNTLLCFDASTIALQFGGILVGKWTIGGLLGVAVGWGGGSLLACALGVVWLNCAPQIRSGTLFIVGSWKSSSAYFVEAVAGSFVGAVTGMAIGLVAGYESVGGYRAALSLMGLTSIAINFVRSVYLRDLRSEMLHPAWSLSATVGRLTLFFGIAVGLVSGVLMVIPDSLGGALFGDSWLLAVSLLGAVAINRFAASLSVIPTVMLRAQGVTWRAARVRLLIVSSGLAFGPLGAVFGGSAGALVGESITYFLLALVLLIVARNEQRSPNPVRAVANP